MYRGFPRGHQYTLWQKEKDPDAFKPLNGENC